MTKEEAYIKHKKQNVIRLVNNYNQTAGYDDPFQFDERNLNLEKTFCTPQRCMECGMCCETYPCVFSPYDFLDICNHNYMENIFNTGVVTISSTNNGLLVIRPRGMTDRKTITSLYSEDNACLMLGEQGCMLPPEYRPSNGLLYYPINDIPQHRIMYSCENIDDEYEQLQPLMWKYYYEYKTKVIPLETVHHKETWLPHCTEEAAMNLTQKLAGYKR